jgi:hypothetical protein
LKSGKEGEGEPPKLVSFSDSRQEAAKAAIDIERNHHLDLRREAVVTALEAAKARRLPLSNLQEELSEVMKAIEKATSETRFEEIPLLARRAGDLKLRLQEVEDPTIAITEVVENVNEADRWRGSVGKRERLKPLINIFVSLGIHPTDDMGVSRYESGLGDTRRSFAWTELFEETNAGYDWRDVEADQIAIDHAREDAIQKTYELLSDTIFSKNYFSFEESGLGYPCLPPGQFGSDRNAESHANAFVRVLADSYRHRYSTFSSDRKDELKEWSSVGAIPRLHRVRKFAKASISGEKGSASDEIVEAWIDERLRNLKKAEHESGKRNPRCIEDSHSIGGGRRSLLEVHALHPSPPPPRNWHMHPLSGGSARKGNRNGSTDLV